MLIIETKSVMAAEVEPDGQSVVVPFIDANGVSTGVRIPTAMLIATVGVLADAHQRALATGAPQESPQLSAKPVQSWTLGTTKLSQDPIVVFDHGLPGQVAYRLPSQTARELGRGLIKSARDAEQRHSQARNHVTN